MMVAATTSAAAPKTPPATATAVWKPVRNAPLATIPPRTATPTTLPVWRAALMTPPAMPTCSGGRGHCGRGRGRHREGHPESSREGQHRDHHVRGFCGEQHEAAEADRADYQAGEHGGERAPPGDGTAAQR